jgi:hypothetical protein
MPCKDVRAGMVGLGFLMTTWLGADRSAAQSPAPSAAQSVARPSPQSEPCSSLGADPIRQLLRMSPEQLDGLYRQASAGPIPVGKARGNVLFLPGTAMAAPITRASKVVWQGKVFQAEDGTAINKFFGVRVIRGNVYYGESWMDGRPSIILDYQNTSLVYAKNRDEFREVAPGLFLGLMYARTSPRPTFKMYFALQVP